MTTAVVVTTIVTDQPGEETVAEQLLDQVRQNTETLQVHLTQRNLEAQVTSAVVDVADFVLCVNEWLRRRGEAAITPAAAESALATPVAELSEADFMDYVLDQIDQGRSPGYARISAEQLAATDEEEIGAHFSQHPYLY